MKDLLRIHFFNDDDDIVILPDDDVDQLFLQMEQVEPPPTLVDIILASVARLPRHQFLSDTDNTRQPWDGFGTLVVPIPHL